MTTAGLVQIWRGIAGTYLVAKLGARENFIQAGLIWGLALVPGS